MTHINLNVAPVADPRPHLNHKAGLIERIIFISLVLAGLLFAGFNLVNDIIDLKKKEKGKIVSII